MNSDDAPRLKLLPFVLGDAAFLSLAALIAYRHPHPFEPLPLILITLCVAAGAVTLMIPLFVNYMREQEESAAALRHELTEQFKKLMAASEYLQRASAQLKTIEESAGKAVQAAEKLPARLQQRQADSSPQSAGPRGEEMDSLRKELAALRAVEDERLAAMADKISKATTGWARIEADLVKPLGALAELEPRLAAALAALDAKIAALGSTAQTVETAAETPKPPRKPRTARNPRNEERAPAEPSAEPQVAASKEPAGEQPAPDDSSPMPPEEKRAVPAPSGDGQTRLTVVSYIGIGNKLFLRGEGPGLSWDKGVPLQFVSIGRWRWETDAATAPVACKVYLNDRTESSGEAIFLPPGAEQEVNVTF